MAGTFRFLRNLNRTRQILTVLLRYGFGDVIERMPMRRMIVVGKRKLFRQPIPAELPSTRGRRIRMALQSLGPTFIKFGQVASTRPDLVPADILEELTKLQESVPAFAFKQAKATIEREFGQPIENLFVEFEEIPVAAGSLAQVHRAVLADGRVVAVKIRRPGVVRIIERDLSLMHELAKIFARNIPESAPFDPVGLVKHFARTIRRELDFHREGRTIQEFGRLFADDDQLYVPSVYTDLTTPQVVTMEFIEGLHVHPPTELTENGVSRAHVASEGSRIFMKQAFEFGLFHGDPHPGNIRVMPDGSICLLDYGMVGMLDEDRREQLIDLFLAIVKNNVPRAVDVVLALSENRERPDDLHQLRNDVREFIDTYYGVELSRLRVAQMLTDFVRILAQHRIRCPANLMLLIRSLVQLEGVGRELDPEFNLAEHLAPFVNKVVKERYSFKNIARRLMLESREILSAARGIPVNLNRVLEKLANDELTVRMEHRGFDKMRQETDKVGNRVVIALIVSSLIVASALIIQTGSKVLWFSVPVFLLSSLLGIWLIWAVFRSGRM